MPEIYVPDEEDPLNVYRHWKKRGWWKRQSKKTILKVGLIIGVILAAVVGFLLQNGLPSFSFNFGIG